MKIAQFFETILAKQLICLILICLLLLLTNSSAKIATGIEHPIAFQLREHINPPQLDPRIKIFNFDDKTVVKLKRFDIKLESWAKIFRTLDKSNPKAILIDKLFDKMNYKAKDIAAFNKIMQEVNTPLISIAFVRDDEISYRENIDIDDFGMQNKFPSEPFAINYSQSDGNGYAYGANKEIRSNISGIGHAVYNGDNHYDILKKVGNKGLLPHWAVFAADKVAYEDGNVILDDQKIPTKRNFRVLINTLGSSTLFRKSERMLPVIINTYQNKKIEIVNEGDYVVILPAMYTGNTDWRESALGSVPGGFLMTSMLNSVVTKTWISEIHHNWFLFSLAFLAAFFLGSKCNKPLIPISFTIVVSFVVISLISFVYFNLFIPWVLPIFIFVICISIFVSDRSRTSRAERIRMEQELATAKMVQESFFPKVETKRLGITPLFKPSTECGGDWWGHFSADDQREYIVIADATGHGVGAALVTAMSFATTKTASLLIQGNKIDPSPLSILEHINSALSASTGGNTTMTMTVLCIDFIQSKVHVANAGHCFPYLIPSKKSKRRNKFIQLTSAGLPIGMSPKVDIIEKSYDFNVDDKIILYTDGIYENPDSKGNQWGQRSFNKIINKNCDKNAAELVKLVDKGSVLHLNGFPQEDDVTLIGIDILRDGS